MEKLRWIAAAALSAYACHLAVQHTTPIDSALPAMAVAVTLLAWLSYSEVMVGVPLLIVAEIAIPDETLRLLAFGAVLASCVTVSLAVPSNRRNLSTLSSRASSEGPGWVGRQAHTSSPSHPGPSLDARDDRGNIIVAILAIVLLRWLPFSSVKIGPELVLLALAVGIVLVLGRTPFAVSVAVMASLVTTLIPLRTLVIPLAVLLAAAIARTIGMPALRLTWPSTVILAFAMLFLAWSGVVARAFPYFLRPAGVEKPRTEIQQALGPGKSETWRVPEGATSLIVSGANVAHLRQGMILGRIEPGPIDIRIGEAADWGYLRREAWHKAHNPLPRDAAGKVRDYGYDAWVDGAGRIALPRGARTIRVTADGALPAHATLQVEGFE